MMYPCADVDDKNIFFVEMDSELHGTTVGRQMTREAVKTCGTCPALEQCGTIALADPTYRGVMGGMTETQRRNKLRAMYT